MTVIAIILVVVFSIVSLICGLTLYEYDPNVLGTVARLQNRFEFLVLLAKLGMNVNDSEPIFTYCSAYCGDCIFDGYSHCFCGGFF